MMVLWKYFRYLRFSTNFVFVFKIKTNLLSYYFIIIKKLLFSIVFVLQSANKSNSDLDYRSIVRHAGYSESTTASLNSQIGTRGRK